MSATVRERIHSMVTCSRRRTKGPGGGRVCSAAREGVISLTSARVDFDHGRRADRRGPPPLGQNYRESRTRDVDFTTLSGLEVDPLPPRRPRRASRGLAGPVVSLHPGLYPTGYRGRPWTIRQFAGFGNAQQTNERYKMLLAAGGAVSASRSTCRR